MTELKHMSFSWNDSGIMDTLLGKLPSIRTHINEEVRELIRALEETYDAYDAFCTDSEDFISRVETQVAKIYQVSPYWNGLNLSVVKRSMKQHQFCLISGEGGIGKSYFVKCLEEHIEDAGIPHLCIYGKFKKNLGGIDFEEIRAEEKFVLIVDAVNEMPQEMQLELYEHLKELKDIRGCRIIVTYRTNRLTNDVLEKYTALAEDEYVFPGVSFESALDCLTRNAASDVYLYEDILYSNNPLLLSILSKVLSKYKMTNQKLNSITSVTYIFEQYIKNAVDKPSWEKTKSIAAWMYQNNCRSISYVQIADMFQDTFDQTGIVLPPADMIKRLGLKPNVKDMTWIDSKGEVVLYCNNCKYSYYSSPIGNTVFIRKDVYDRYMEENGIIFFAYAERYHHATGYVDETSLHFEIERGEISREFCNNGGAKIDIEREITNCDSCPYGFNDKELDNSEFSEFLQSLHYNYGDECT